MVLSQMLVRTCFIVKYVNFLDTVKLLHILVVIFVVNKILLVLFRICRLVI